MKFKVTYKTPDALQDAIKEAVKKDLTLVTYEQDEREAIQSQREQKAAGVCTKWFEYGEYLTVEIDTEERTCTVIERT